MNNMLDRDMLEATRLTKAGRLGEATALLQRLLGGGRAPAAKARAESPTGREASTVWGNGERMNQRPSPAGPTHARDIGAQGFGPAQAGLGKGVSGGLHFDIREFAVVKVQFDRALQHGVWANGAHAQLAVAF